ncbi:tRNA pseudouridine synthase D [archaeon HR04]|nr:tRNA pseudouridine synthase D [archaeon HR04]
MEEEGISSKDFYIKEMQEVSVEGGFRPSPLLLLYNTFEMVSSNGGIRVRFALPKGSYATVLLREVIKPAQPTLVGF